MDIYCDFRARSIASLHVQTGQATNKAPIFGFISKKTRFMPKKVSPHTLELWQRTFCPQRTRTAFILYCYFAIRSLLR